MPTEAYFNDPRISKSSLDNFARCPAYYRAMMDRKVEREVTPAMQFGTLLHSLVLDGKADFYTRPDDVDYRNKAGKEWRDAHTDKPVLKRAEADELHGMASAILRHPHAAPLFGKGKSEAVLFGVHRKTKLPIKGCLDWLGPRHIADIKTTADASSRGLSKSIAAFRYHVQAAMYLELAQQNGLDTPAFYFIAIERGEHPMINVRLLSEAAVELGRATLDKQMGELLACMESGIWPDYSGPTESPQIIDLPSWAYTETGGCELIGVEMADPVANEISSNDLIP